ncbi:RNA polymerase sigma-70 factor [Flavobacterium ajazii]|uniref:RNA polymerase sigma-70 factor n=1 Tax=Flavobacterium ajazii TaxID=2692318 RepID=UPI0013D1446B|nr:RNA polymerase sigma-70 factor [Flavobacterium ajazii]
MAEVKTLSIKEYKNIYETMYEVLCLFANKYVDNLDLSKDIVQDIFIKIWEEQTQFHGSAYVKSFLYTAVRNRSLDYLKSKQVKSTFLLSDKVDFADVEADPFFLQEVAIAETANIIDNAIDTLPAQCAKIMKLSIKGKSNQEIADDLNLSLNTVKVQKSIAYKKLKHLLGNYFVFIAFVFDIHK